MDAVATTSPATPPPSLSFAIRPNDKRCRYWAKVVRADQDLPLPSDVTGADDIPGPYLRSPGVVRLFPGDVLFEGEANHHRHDWGWSYWVTYVDSAGEQLTSKSGFGRQKLAAKAQGLARELLAGAGPGAGAVRVAHARRAGLQLP